MNKYEQILDAARLRGLARGIGDYAEGYQNESPLSGEWAGESITELLGDLLDAAERLTGVEIADSISEICDEYLKGYDLAFEDMPSLSI